MTPLAAALLSAVTIWTTPSGNPVPARHVRDLGGAAYVEHVAHHVEDAALLSQVDAHLLAALVLSESALNPYAVSSRGAYGLGQLMPGSVWGRRARSLCKGRSALDCRTEVSVLVAGEALRHGFIVCGDWGLAIGWYRSGRCVRGGRVRLIVEMAQVLREHSNGHSGS